MKKLESLTDKQIQLIEEVRNKWLARFFGKRKPLKKKKAIELIHWLYEFSNLEKPLVVFVNSPAGAEIAANILNGDQVRNQLGNQVKDQVKDQKLEFYYFSSYGNIWDMGWLSFYDFFDRIGIDLGYKTNFYKFKKLIQCNIYDMIQLDKYCIVCEYPTRIERDARNNLHNEIDSAIEWKDGYKLWFLHGIALDKELWEKVVSRKLTFSECMKLSNIEQRMIALKYLDPQKLLDEAQAKLVSKIRGYELYKVEKIFPQTQYFLKYKDPSTDRIYISGIDPQVGVQKDAIKALKWKFYLEDSDELFNQES